MSLTQRYGKSSRSSGNGNCLEANYQKSSRSTHGENCLEVNYQKPSRSAANGACLEANYAKSTRSGNNDCVEACAPSRGIVRVRDTKDREAGLVDDQPTLTFTAEDWQTFTDEIKAGKYDFGLVKNS